MKTSRPVRGWLAGGATVFLAVAAWLLVVYAPRERARSLDGWRLRLSSTADDRRLAVSRWVEGGLQDAAILADYPTLRYLLTGDASGGLPFPPEIGAAGHARELMAQFARRRGYEAILLFGADETVLVGWLEEPDRAGNEAACHELVAQVQATARQAVELHRHGEQSAVVFAVPVGAGGETASGAGGEPPGVLAVVADPAEWLFPFLLDEPTPTRTGETVLGVREGDHVLFLSPLRHHDDPSLTVRFPLERPGFALRPALAGEEATGWFVDYRDEPVLAAVRPVAGTPWGLVTKVDRSEVVASYAGRIAATVFGALGLLAALLTGVLLLIRGQQRRYSRLVSRLADTEERLTAFFESDVIGMIFGDVHGCIEVANDEFLRIVGYSPLEFEQSGPGWADLTPAEWIPVDSEHIAEAREHGTCTPYEKEYFHHDGHRVPVLVGYALLGEEREDSVAFILDLSERKKIDRHLREEMARFQTVVDASPIPIFALSPEGAVTLWNRAAEQVFGWTSDEIRGRPLPIVSAEQQEEFHSLRRQVMDGGSFTGLELRRRRRDGEPVDIVLSTAPLRDASGETVGIMAVCEDVTERMKIRSELKQLNLELEDRVKRRTAELEQANRELEAYSYSVSHDLRAPLRAIDGFSRILREEYAERLDEEGRRLLGVIVESVGRMEKLIDDLLSFSRTSRKELQSGSVDMSGLVKSVWYEHVTSEDRERIDFHVADLPPAEGDPVLLRQLWHNLISNALKFTTPRERPRIEVTGQRETDRNIYVIRDNGVGFDPRNAGQLFRVFQRLHSVDQFPGTGIGLALVQRIVHRHGGTISAEGKVDAGAAFTFTLPIRGDGS